MGIKAISPELIRKRQKVLKEYQWSSYKYYAGWSSVPGWLSVEKVLAASDKANLQGQRAAYRSYTESSIGEAIDESVLERAAAGFLLGSKDWVDHMRRLLKGDFKEQKALRKLQIRPEWDKIRIAVERVKGERWQDFCDRYGDWGRDMALYIARQRCGMKLKELGNAAGVRSYYTVAQAVKRINRRLKTDRLLLKTLEQIIDCTNVKT